MSEPPIISSFLEVKEAAGWQASDKVSRSKDKRQWMSIPVRGHHLRAARGILGWSLQTLAEKSDLSLSTLRRLEEFDGEASKRTRFKVLLALGDGGARFVLLNGRVVAIGLAVELDRIGTSI